jgi:uncharacterized protein
MLILVSGSSGLVGSALIPVLTAGGHEIRRLVRTPVPANGQTVHWNPDVGIIHTGGLEGLDAVVHLAGESIASGRWNDDKKARIRDSRVKGTRFLCETLAKAARRPAVLVCASAVGYYGSRGDEFLTEESAPGSGFLAEVCRDWEEATETAGRAGIRVVNLRFGVILSPKGGALKQMLLPFKLGAGGVIGDGRQFVSWIALDDVVAAIMHSLATDALRGPVNTVAPNPVTNYDYTKTLGRVLSRPTVMPMPGFVARIAFGEMADELLLSSQRAVPKRLQEAGYAFRFPELEGALRHLLNRPVA